MLKHSTVLGIPVSGFSSVMRVEQSINKERDVMVMGNNPRSNPLGLQELDKPWVKLAVIHNIYRAKGTATA